MFGMKKLKNKSDMSINYLINSINFQLKNGEFERGLIQEYWVELLILIKKISWDDKLIQMYNPKFYDEYVKTGYLKKRFNYKNGVPLNWELENGFGDK